MHNVILYWPPQCTLYMELLMVSRYGADNNRWTTLPLRMYMYMCHSVHGKKWVHTRTLTLTHIQRSYNANYTHVQLELTEHIPRVLQHACHVRLWA